MIASLLMPLRLPIGFSDDNTNQYGHLNSLKEFNSEVAQFLKSEFENKKLIMNRFKELFSLIDLKQWFNEKTFEFECI